MIQRAASILKMKDGSLLPLEIRYNFYHLSSSSGVFRFEVQLTTRHSFLNCARSLNDDMAEWSGKVYEVPFFWLRSTMEKSEHFVLNSRRTRETSSCLNVHSSIISCNQLDFFYFFLFTISAKVRYQDCWPGRQEYRLSDVGLLCQRTQRRICSVHRASRQTHGPSLEILLSRPCADGCSGIVAIPLGVCQDQRGRVPPSDVGLHVPGSAKGHECRTRTGSSDFDHGCPGTVYRDIRCGVHDRWLFHWAGNYSARYYWHS